MFSNVLSTTCRWNIYRSSGFSCTIDPIEKPECGRSRKIKRGLYKSYVGQLINADINGTINILQKIVDDSILGLINDRGLVNRPNRLRLALSLLN